MREQIYKQYDSRWGNKAYPDKKSSFSGNGCGCCAVLHCVIERDKYKDCTPANAIKYMKRFAVSGQGTTWDGIPTALKHYGMKNVKEHATMPKLWTELEKGRRVGVILFSAGAAGKDGTVWTSGGHYVAFTAYKKKGSKHWLYMKDSGPRDHDGWYCYEDSMFGKCFKVWSAEIPKEEKSKTEQRIEKVLANAAKWAKDNKFHYVNYESKDKKTQQCPICHPELQKVKKYCGWNCIGFVSACYFHAGVKTVQCRAGGIVNDGFAKYTNITEKKFRARNGNCWKMVYKKKTSCPTSKLKAGDVMIGYAAGTNTFKHIVLYAGNGYIYDCTSSRSDQCSKRKLSSSGRKYYVIFRYVGN